MQNSELNAYEEDMLNRIKADDRVQFIALISGKRAIVRIPVELIHAHKVLSKIRNADPKIDLLTESVKNVTGGDSLYCVSLFCDTEDGELIYYAGDGHQRLRALKDSKAEFTDAQVVLHWHTPADAMAGGLSANMARAAMTDADIFSVINSGAMSEERLRIITGFQESKLRRYVKVAGTPWMAKFVVDGCFGYSKAASLLDVAGDSPEKKAALQIELEALREVADAGVDEYTAKAATSNIGKKGRDKTKLDYWFRSFGEQIDDIKAKVELGQVEQRDGVYHVMNHDTAKVLVATIGTKIEWKKTLALENFFGRGVTDVPVSSYDEVLDNWDSIREHLRDGRRLAAIHQSGANEMKTDPASVRKSEKQTPPNVSVDNN